MKTATPNTEPSPSTQPQKAVFGGSLMVGVLLAVTVNVSTVLGEELKNKVLVELPSGPSGPGRFGAYYTKLKYSSEWDKPWRVSHHADVVVQFDDGGHKFLFWRRTSYIPCWVTDAGVWYSNEFAERRGHHSPHTEAPENHVHARVGIATGSTPVIPRRS